jgi:hypothetical protein
MRNANKILSRKLQRMKLYGWPKHISDDNIKMNFKYTGCDNADWASRLMTRVPVYRVQR